MFENKSFVIENHISVFDAMKKLDEIGQRILVIVDQEGGFLGVVTDGDIRRFILGGGDLSMSVDLVTNKEPVYLPERDLVKAEALFRDKRYVAIPVVNIKNRLESVIFWEDVFKEKRAKKQLNLPVVIMAGGKGTRLYPYTNVIPKPLIPIGEEPIIERIMNRFNEYGCRHFTLTVNYKRI